MSIISDAKSTKIDELLHSLLAKHDEIQFLKETLEKQKDIIEENDRLFILNKEYKKQNKKLKKKLEKEIRYNQIISDNSTVLKQELEQANNKIAALEQSLYNSRQMNIPVHSVLAASDSLAKSSKNFKFNVGDIVNVINKYEISTKGKGTVKKVDEDGHLGVLFDSEIDLTWFKPNELERTLPKKWKLGDYVLYSPNGDDVKIAIVVEPNISEGYSMIAFDDNHRHSVHNNELSSTEHLHIKTEFKEGQYALITKFSLYKGQVLKIGATSPSDSNLIFIETENGKGFYSYKGIDLKPVPINQ